MKMKLKQIVLKKFESSNNHFNSNNNNYNNNCSLSFVNICEQKQITDFSIKRILSDTNTKNKNSLKNIKQTGIQLNEVLDLSKTKQQHQHYDVINNNNNIHKYFMFQNNYVNEQYLTITSSKIMCNPLWPIHNNVNNNNETVIKPKVYKSWEQTCFNNNCNDCEIYFKSFNFGQKLITKAPASTTTTAIGTITEATTISTNNKYNYGINYPWSDLVLRKNFNNNIVGNLVSKSMTTNTNIQLNIDNRKDDDEISHKCQFCDKVFGCATTLQVNIYILKLFLS